MRINEKWRTAPFKTRTLYGHGLWQPGGYDKYEVAPGDRILYEEVREAPITKEQSTHLRLGRVIALAVEDGVIPRKANHLWVWAASDDFHFGYERVVPFDRVRQICGGPNPGDFARVFFTSPTPTPERLRALLNYCNGSDGYIAKYIDADGNILDPRTVEYEKLPDEAKARLAE